MTKWASVGALLLAGCMALSGPLAYQYIPELPAGPPVPFHMAMEPWRDDRPTPAALILSTDPRRASTRPATAGDRSATRRIEPVAAQVTMALMEDFRSAGLFQSVVLTGPAPAGALRLRGSIRRFTWSGVSSPLAFIPGINLLLLFGIPAFYTEGRVTLHLQLIEPSTDRVLADYEKTATMEDSFTMYYGASESGAELAAALKSVSQQLKAAIRADYAAGTLTPARPVP